MFIIIMSKGAGNCDKLVNLSKTARGGGGSTDIL